jgi:hypothetical protein
VYHITSRIAHAKVTDIKNGNLSQFAKKQVRKLVYNNAGESNDGDEQARYHFKELEV